MIGRTYGFPKISTGDLLRKAVQDKTPLGRKAAAAMAGGGLVADEIVLGLVEERIEETDCRNGYILDGFPRNIAQAKSLDAMEKGRVETAIEILIDETYLLDRLTNRRSCPSCGAVFNLLLKKPLREGICDICGASLVLREDDKPEVIRERLRVYREKTEPLRAYYKTKGVYHGVDGTLDIDRVFESVRTILDAEIEKVRRTEADS